MRELIKRNTPAIADMFILETVESEGGKNVFTLSARDGKIVLGGDCTVSQAMAYGYYLKNYCGAELSHSCGTDLTLIEAAPLPEGEYRKVIPQEKRVYLDYGTFGYSCAFWGWEEWEKEIDFMAMNGINMPLSVVGSEAVWFYTLREFKYKEAAALSYLSGPAFWAWQLRGNLWSYFPLTEKSYIDARLELGKKIIRRETELGMTPVQQGWWGIVPRSLSRQYKTSRITLQQPWSGFPSNSHVEFTDTLFRKFGMAFLEKQKQLFGCYHHYLTDPFFDVKLPKKKHYMWRAGRAIDALLRDFDGESVWVIHSRGDFEELYRSVPAGRMLVLDTEGKYYESTDGFYGHNFILGTSCNVGGRTTLHGNIRALASNGYAEAKEKYEKLCGTGFFPEGLEQNPLYFELATDMLTEEKSIDIGSWLASYAKRRYGSEEKCLYDAVKALADSCYGEACTGPETGSIICARPSTHLKHAAIGDTLEIRYDNDILKKAFDCLLAAENADTEAYRHDVCDVARQLLSNKETALYKEAVDAYYSKDIGAFEKVSNRFLKMLEELDALLQTRPEFCLQHHLSKAGALAETDKDRQNYELNLLCQITIWGPIGSTVNYDCGWKEWGGLVDSFYAKRWYSFFEQLAVYFKKRRFKTETRKQINERNEYAGSAIYKNYEKFEKNWLSTVNPPEPTDGDTAAMARELVDKYCSN